MPALTLGEYELWAIRDYVRQHDRLGHEWDKDFERRLFLAIQAAGADPNRQAALEFAAEDELWQIHRQVPSGLMVGTQNVGRSLLLKVQAAILAWGPVEDHEDDGPTEQRLPDFMTRWEIERERAQRGFERYEGGTP